VVDTSGLMYLPSRYVAVALAAHSLTPRLAWKQIWALIINDPSPTVVVDLAPLVDWLQVALTTVEGDPSPVCPAATDPPNYPYPYRNELQDVMERHIDNNLPGLQPVHYATSWPICVCVCLLI
jgi:hypothetical protein